jgi:hypothetical protein
MPVHIGRAKSGNNKAATQQFLKTIPMCCGAREKFALHRALFAQNLYRCNDAVQRGASQ